MIIKMNIFNFYFLLLLIEFSASIDKIYRINIGLFNPKDKESDSNFINNLFFNRIYANLSIGTPPQILPFELDSKSQTFCISNEFFNKSLSSSYIQVSRENYFYNEDVENGFNSEDILNIDNNKEKINFILATKYPYNKKNILGILGLKIPKFVDYKVYPFFKSLKQAQMIKNYKWTLKYFDNINLLEQITYNKEKANIIGEFIFGNDPHIYEQDKIKYNENEFFKVNALSTPESIFWGLEFNNIYITRNNNIKIFYTKEKKAEIVINFSFIMGPQSFFEFINENFFVQYTSKGICSEKKGNSYETYIECDNVPNFKISSFPDLSFDHIGFESTFKLTYKDLFILDEKNNKYIFLILKKDYVTEWCLGTVFLRKYQLVFDEDLKTIGYYRQPDQHYEGNSNNTNMTDINDEKGKLNEVNKSNKVKKAFIVILIVIFSFLLFFFGMIFQRKYCNKNRKIRANELEENFSYDAKNNNDKKIMDEENGENKI